MVEGTDFGSLILLQLEIELVKHVVILGDAAGIVEVEMSSVQEGIWVSRRGLLVAEVAIGDGSLLVGVGVGIILVLLGWEPLHVA
jgi:hypothetical protein